MSTPSSSTSKFRLSHEQMKIFVNEFQGDLDSLEETQKWLASRFNLKPEQAQQIDLRPRRY